MHHSPPTKTPRKQVEWISFNFLATIAKAWAENNGHEEVRKYLETLDNKNVFG
jgi:hypothetical protein